ncbi:PAS domain S-box protein [Maribacter sp. MMG018]|uniref:PAS domain S-box protein n=1 Tax=Maribacter sp. MMG018 TaxID=2822688 RepID=UPI001B36F039|nr:PAS domain S-box protein [Maribacter sp. MMG018]MBQ4913362.1 PAS domain S-box protein [Maribacter sp. MMG018]
MIRPLKQNILKKPILVGFVVFIIVLCFAQFFVYQRFLLLKSLDQEEINLQALRVKEGLLNVFNQSFATTQSLSFIIGNYGVPSDFDSISQLLLDSNDKIDAIELVNKEGVITHVYPLQGNDVTGFNILQDSIGKQGALKTIKQKDFFLTGPIKLKQGGSGFVGRTPIFKNGSFEGFSAAVIKLSSFLSAIPTDSVGNDRFLYQLAKINPDKSEEVFFSSKKIDVKNAQSVPITLGKGELKLYVISNNRTTLYTILIFCVLGFLLAIIAGLFVVFLIRQPKKLNKMVEEKIKLFKESEEKYKTLIEQASDGIFITTNEGKILETNLKGSQMFGYSKEELSNKYIKELLAQGETERLPIQFAALKTGQTVRAERKLITKDGQTFYGEVKSKMLPNNTVLGIVRDTTERKKLELIAENNLQKFSMAFNTRTIGMAIFDQHLNFVDANAYFLELIGYPLHEIKGKRIRDIGPLAKDQDSKLEEALQSLKLHGRFSSLEIELLPRNSTIVHLLASAETYTYNGETHILATYVDRTEAKKAQIKMAQSENKYRELTERISDAYVAFDKDWNFVYINARAARIIDKKPDDVLGKNMWEEFPEFANSPAFSVFNNSLKNQKYAYLEHHNNEFNSWLAIHVYPSPSGSTVYFRNITRKKLAEKENQKLLSIIENSLGFIGSSDLEGTSVYINDAGKKLVGLTPENDLSNISVFDFFSEESKEIIYNEYLPLIHEKGSWNGEVYLKNLKTNKYVPVEFSAFIITDRETKEPIGIGAVAFDLSERKKTEKEILSLQSKMDAAIRIGKIGYWSWDIKTETIDWSDRMYEIYDVEPGTVIDAPFSRTLIHKDDIDFHDRMLARNIEARDHSPFSYRIVQRDNTVKHVLVQMEVVMDENGVPIRYQGTAVDITSQKEAEKALRETQEKFSKAFYTNLIGMFILDKGRKIVEVNSRACTILNSTRETLLGHTIMESGTLSINNNDSLLSGQLWEIFLENKEVKNEEFKVTLQNGKVISILLSIESLMLEGVEHYLVTIVDNTKRKEAEELLEEQNVELKKTNSELDSFVYSASHELRAPLTSVMGLIQIMMDEQQESHCVHQLQMMENSITRLDDFIKEIIAFSRNRNLEVQLDEIDFHDLIDDVLESLWYLKNIQAITFVKDIKNDVPFISDKKRVMVLLNNLISNAIKYHDIDKDNPTVWINIRTSQQNVVIEIKDNGPGIEKELQNKIFDMFYRVSAKVMGSGIGLYIVKEILNKLGGSINVESKPKKGSSFIITVPNITIKN